MKWKTYCSCINTWLRSCSIHLHSTSVSYTLPAIIPQGSQRLWNTGKTWKNEFPFFQTGKTQGIWEKLKKSGKTQGNSILTHKNNISSDIDAYVYRFYCKSHVHHWTSARFVRLKYLLEFNDLLREKSGKTQGILFSRTAGNPVITQKSIFLNPLAMQGECEMFGH